MIWEMPELVARTSHRRCSTALGHNEEFRAVPGQFPGHRREAQVVADRDAHSAQGGWEDREGPPRQSVIEELDGVVFVVGADDVPIG